MNKQINLVLEVESDDAYMISDEFIKHDIALELNCASNYYVLKSIGIKEVRDASGNCSN